MRGSVLQDWLADRCSWKEQTVVLCALRGPDTGSAPELKAWTRWLRQVALRNADPAHPFMVTSLPELPSAIRPVLIDMLSVHYLSHLMHALEVVAYRHPDPEIHHYAQKAYVALCAFLHVTPENYDEMRQRLRDKVPA
jgi:hypothetical protein